MQIESEADEIYVPETVLSDNEAATGAYRGKHGIRGQEDAGIVGYQKYLHIMGKVILDNTDQFEPNMPNFSSFLAVNEEDWDSPQEEKEPEESEQEETEDEQDQTKVMNKSKFNFSGMSFKDYVRSIQEELNDELRILVNCFIQQKQVKHHSVHLTQRKLQVKHPIFRLITLNCFKWILDRAFLFKLKKGQTAYRQNFDAMRKVYFVLYGAFDFKYTVKTGKQTDYITFGERIGLGWTVGEEVQF